MSKHKVKGKTYIVLQGGGFRQPRTIGRYRVGAKNEEEACELLRSVLGKHTTVRVYYEVNEPNRLLPRGTVVREHVKDGQPWDELLREG